MPCRQPVDRDAPTSENFSYDRRFPPLFFAAPRESERESWHQSMNNVTREYFRLSRKHGINAQTPLSNGATAGEYAMWVLQNNHEKRTTKGV